MATHYSRSSTTLTEPAHTEGYSNGSLYSNDGKHQIKETITGPSQDEPSVLQRHIQFWDRDNDGIIWPLDVYRGFRDLGFGLFFAIGSLLIPVFFSYPTRLGHSILPDPLLRIYVRDIHKAKHGSDSGVYDFDGNFSAGRFEQLWQRFDPRGVGGLGAREVYELWKKDRCAADPAGWSFAAMEWWTTYVLLQKDGKVWKEDLRACYDGSLFWRIKEERDRAQKKGRRLRGRHSATTSFFDPI